MKYSIKPREIIHSLTPYVPGTPVENIKNRYGLKTVYKLASNENLCGVSENVIREIKENINEISYYPDGDALLLKNRLAKFFCVDEKNIILGAGSDELIMYICITFLEKGDNVIQSWPAFIRYLQNAKIMAATVKLVPLKNWKHNVKAIIDSIDNKTKIVFIDNPINPVGTYLDISNFEWFMKRVPKNILIVLDEAYFEFVDKKDYPDGLYYLKKFPNLIVLRTFSKSYSLAGVRVGYGICSFEIADWINRVRCPFNVNRVAQIAAAASLKETSLYKRKIAKIKKEREYLQKELTNAKIEFVPSNTNFILINVKQDSSIVYEKLCRKGVIVRPMKGIKEIENYIRLTISPKREVNKYVIKLLNEMRYQGLVWGQEVASL
ncbi:MAG: histidinol-phosphate transaminase [Candidatus Hydrogenedentota bacterium]